MEERSTEPVTRRRLLADAAVLGLLGPGIFLLSGYQWQSAYHHGLGISDPAVLADPPYLMMRGFWLLLGPIAATALIYGTVWSVASIQQKRALDHTSPADLPLLGWAAAGALFAAAMALVTIEDASKDVILGYSILDLGILAVMIPVMSLLVVLSLQTGKVSQLFFGRTLSGAVFVSIILVVSLAGHAQFSGSGDANDLVWGCVDRPAVVLEAPGAGLTNNTTYVVLAHVNNFLYIRDSTFTGESRGALAIRDDEIVRASYFFLPAEDCS